MPECEAERRNLQALYELELDWGSGKFDYGKIRGILTGRDTVKCTPGEGTQGKLKE
ncbi:hypothetical protein QFZ79_002908 [Arthrobacter sp. V4I6]|uniref:hypothetical protein n=1 Tax=Arthrobacter sp. V4I6 TaxID=3042281 RepID=UPI0027849E71|nr:hypothetical protein [Arthrobacter sp. V4I6]MDQ0854797.1 hypothetical protein [Arthrobacter sp. V4I6]